jgi:iron complex outermembrane receptor protein
VRFHLLASSALAIVAIANVAHAQNAVGGQPTTVDQATDQAPATNAAVEEIIVTAQRRAEPLQKAALAVTAVTGNTLVNQGVTDATRLNQVVPALFVTNGGGSNTGYFVRGVGNFTNNGYTAPAVAFNIDDVYAGRPSSTIASFLDLNRVEVLKGPQGTLYGRNATGGAINVIPNKPKLGVFEGNFAAQYGNYDAYELTGVVNAPLGEAVAVRIAAVKSARDGYFDDGTGSANDFAIRGQIYAELNSAINVRLSADYSTQKGTGSGNNIDGVYNFTPFSPTATITNRTFVPAPANVSAPFTGLHTPATLDFIRNTASMGPLFSPMVGYVYPYRNDKFFNTNAEINVDLGAAKFVVIPAFRRAEVDDQFNGPPFKAAIQNDVAKQYSLEGRLSGNLGKLDWILGAYLFDEKVSGQNSFNQFATANFNAYKSRIKSKAVFSRATYHLTDTLRLVGGVRYTDESRSIDGTINTVTAICRRTPNSCPQVPTIPAALTLAGSVAQLDRALFPAANPFGGTTVATAYPYGPFFNNQPGALFQVVPRGVKGTDSDGEVTYRLAAEYDVASNKLLYASYETGFRAGGFNLAIGRESYKPEYIKAWTIGSKNTFFGNRLQVNLEAFYWKYKDQQLGALGVDGEGRNAFVVQNLGASRIKGVELETKALVARNTRLRANVQYLDAVYTDFRYNQVDTSQPTDPLNFQTPFTGCAFQQVTTPSRSFNVDCSGKRALFSPKWTLNFGIDQTVEVGAVNLVGSFGARYRTSRELGFNYLPTGQSGDDWTLDASLSIEPQRMPVAVLIFVRNFTNETLRSTYQAGAGNVTSFTLEAPRTYGVRLGYKF